MFYNVDSTHTNGCKAGWFLSGIVGITGGTTCTSCGANAKECTSSSVIKSCISTHNLVNGMCFPCAIMSASNACNTANTFVVTTITCTVGDIKT